MQTDGEKTPGPVSRGHGWQKRCQLWGWTAWPWKLEQGRCLRLKLKCRAINFIPLRASAKGFSWEVPWKLQPCLFSSPLNPQHLAPCLVLTTVQLENKDVASYLELRVNLVYSSLVRGMFIERQRLWGTLVIPEWKGGHVPHPHGGPSSAEEKQETQEANLNTVVGKEGKGENWRQIRGRWSLRKVCLLCRRFLIKAFRVCTPGGSERECRCLGRILKVEPPRPEMVDGLQLGDERTRCPGRLQGWRGDFTCWGGHHAFTIWALPFHPGEQPSQGMVGSHRLVQALLYDELCFFSVPQNHQTQNTSNEEVSTWQKWERKQQMLGWVIWIKWMKTGFVHSDRGPAVLTQLAAPRGMEPPDFALERCGDTGCEKGL